MIKTDIGYLKAPYYEQRLDSGLSVVFLPRKTRISSALVYVPVGTYPHESSLGGTKIVDGTSYLLSQMILSPSYRKQLAGKGILSRRFQDYSYSAYEVSTLGSLFDATSEILERIKTLPVEEEDLDAFRRENALFLEEEAKDPVRGVEEDCIENLFFASPIVKAKVPSLDVLKRVHASTVRKLLSESYGGMNLTLFLSGDVSVKDVMDHFASFPLRTSPKKGENVPVTFTEDFSKARKAYSESRGRQPYDLLCYGVKFPKREELFQQYGEMLFAFYEFLEDVLFTANAHFQNGILETSSDLLSTKLEQAGEETFLLLTLRCGKESALLSFLSDYLSKLEKQIDSALFTSLKEKYLAKALGRLSLPNTALEGFLKAYPNHLSYPALVHEVKRMSYRDLKGFLGNMSGFAKSASFRKGGE